MVRYFHLNSSTSPGVTSVLRYTGALLNCLPAPALYLLPHVTPPYKREAFMLFHDGNRTKLSALTVSASIFTNTNLRTFDLNE
ncbi:hypothetical protein E2C01_003381 [Portunus trituberculatus]|uniref:Uncharacterized protein n=1 Tax=Portunus trituberculatus TaxID=210409 RepID=A0A5B7CPM1_PORTR|nr:hypothetical protein [Portunus trituberculatus]